MKKYIKIIFVFAAILCCAACASFHPVKERTRVNLRGLKVDIGTTEAEFDKLVSIKDLKKSEINVSYFPEDDVVCLNFRHNLITYYLFWSKANRSVFSSALARYKQAYNTRDLPVKNMQTKRAYGTLRGMLMWESTKFSLRGTSHPNIDIGYHFVNKAPYFSFSVRETPNEDPVTKDNLPRNNNFNVYFTRAQADELAAMFTSEYLQTFSKINDTKDIDSFDIDDFDDEAE